MNIYLSNETSFDRNGLGFLKDCIKATVSETLNGDYILEFTYPLNGVLNEYLVEDNIIKCDVGNDNYQLFRIKKISKSFETIEVYAMHIFYDLLNNMLVNVAPTNKQCSSFGQWILDRTAFSNPFTFTSDISLVKTAKYVRRNPVDAILGDTDNSMVNLFNGEIERDNFTIKFNANRGSNNHVKLLFGKNISSIKMTIDITSLYTRILPLGFDGLTIPELYVDSPIINDYPTPRITKVEFSDIKYDPDSEEDGVYTDKQEFYQALRDASSKLFSNGLDKPQISIKIDWVELSKTEQYKQYQALEKVHLGDTITANILGLDYTTKVVKTKYNPLTNVIEAFEIGTTTKTIANTINQQTQEMSRISPSSIVEQAKSGVSGLITSAMGGYVYKTNEELYIMDTDNPETAQKVWRWNINGLGYSSTGVNGTYNTAMTMDGQIVADMITTGKINTNLIEGYNSLEAKVNKMAVVSIEKEGTGEIQLEGLLENPIMYLSIHPTNTDLTSVRAGTNVYASKSIYASSVVVVFDDIGTGKDYRYALPCDLLQLNGTYDEYVQDNKTKECYVLHKIGKVNGEKVILDTPYKETFTNQFMIGTGNYKIYVLNYNDAYIKAKALLMNDYTTQLATTYQVQSSITETAKEIMIEVNEKVDEDELNSAINVATGSIMAKVNEKVGNDEVIASLNIAVENHKGVVNLKGNSVIIDSDNFNLSADGTIECTNANISGEITSNEGTIGGWEINEKGFSNGVYYLKNNGFINAYTYADMIIIQNYLLGKLAIPDGAISHYDINNDGTITSYELLYFQKVFIDGIDPTAPSTQNDDEEDVSTQSDEEIPSDEEVGELPTQSE